MRVIGKVNNAFALSMFIQTWALEQMEVINPSRKGKWLHYISLIRLGLQNNGKTGEDKV